MHRGKGSQGAEGQLATGAPNTRLIRTKGQALSVADELTAMEIRTSGELLALFEEGLTDHVVPAEHDYRSHADLDLEDGAVALAHGGQAQMWVASNF